MHSYLADPESVPLPPDGMAVFERRPANRILLDDTDPLTCNIEGHQRHEDHTEYIISVVRGVRGSDRWRVRHRYKDFVELNEQLAPARLDIQLPKKKVFGNMDKNFIEDRRQGLQVYLDTVLAHPLLSRCLAVMRFLDPPNYPDSMEGDAARAVQLALRGTSMVSLSDPLPALGWRARAYHQLSTEAGRRQLLTWCPYGPDRCLPLPQLTAVNKCLASIQFPYIQTHEYSRLSERAGLRVAAFCPAGSLRDVVSGTKPGAAPFLAKYGGLRPECAMLYSDIRTIGRQILEALRLLHQRGIPYGHLHSGNVLYDGGVCRLTELENAVWGVPSYYRPYLVRHRRLGTTEAADLYGLGHVLHELTFGRPLLSDCVDRLPADLMPELGHVLQSLLSEEALKKGLPTVEELLETPLFRDVIPPLPVSSAIKMTPQCRELFRTVKATIEQRLQQDQKLYRHQRRLDKTEALLNDEEKRRVRRQLQVKRQKEGLRPDNVSDSGSSSSFPRSISPGSSSSSARPRGVPAPPPPPPPPVAPLAAGADTSSSPAAPPGGSGDVGRRALLDSISAFDKSGLRRSAAAATGPGPAR